MTLHWRLDDLGDLRGHTAVVTGANSGLGYETTLALAEHGASVVLACRSPERASLAVERIRAKVPHSVVTVGLVDLADLASVHRFADSLAGTSLELLVNNAGVMALPHLLTADGFEMQFGTNHLGHFALTGRLLAALLRTPSPRVVTVSSLAHVFGRMAFEDLQHEHHYRRWVAYGQAKLANLLFAFELDRRAKVAGARLVSVAAHPGYAATNLQTAGPRMEGNAWLTRVAEIGNRLVAQPASLGAEATLCAATAPGLRGGEFIGPRLGMWGHPAQAWCTPAARNEANARRLWTVSEQLTGVTYDALGPVRD
jgi:NAD(P)-dependent dehydrogenase (short-subunit alcohol dehydrogenase family)